MDADVDVESILEVTVVASTSMSTSRSGKVVGFPPMPPVVVSKPVDIVVVVAPVTNIGEEVKGKDTSKSPTFKIEREEEGERGGCTVVVEVEVEVVVKPSEENEKNKGE